jgi:ZIP family zinc transporter
MLEAGVWGLIGASSLLIGALLGVKAKLSDGAIGIVMAFGAGTLISAVAFELTEEAYRLGGADVVAAGLALGAGAYFVGSVAIANRGGARRMAPSSRADADAPRALVLGAVLDGIPESAVIGISLLDGGSVGVPILAAVFISNLPEAISSSRGMHLQGVATGYVLRIWVLVCVVSAVSAAAGYGLLSGGSDDVTGLLQSFAGGAVLMMLTDTMIPEAYKLEAKGSTIARSGIGLFTVLGFALAYLLSTLD